MQVSTIYEDVGIVVISIAIALPFIRWLILDALIEEIRDGAASQEVVKSLARYELLATILRGGTYTIFLLGGGMTGLVIGTILLVRIEFINYSTAYMEIGQVFVAGSAAFGIVNFAVNAADRIVRYGGKIRFEALEDSTDIEPINPLLVKGSWTVWSIVVAFYYSLYATDILETAGIIEGTFLISFLFALLYVIGAVPLMTVVAWGSSNEDIELTDPYEYHPKELERRIEQVEEAVNGSQETASPEHQNN